MKRRRMRIDWSALAAEDSSRLDRQGSTLLIVIALLGLLSLLGFVFYTFAAQERQNANYFSDAAMLATDPGLDYDAVMDWGLEQLVIGPQDQFRQSALWKGRHSMVPNMFGADLQPYSGEGVNVMIVNASTGEFAADQNYDDTPDSPALLNWNDSPVAWNGFSPINNRPAPDVDYTYPDINNAFIAFRGLAYDSGSGTEIPVLIPSFHRPQYLRQAGALPTWEPVDDWATNSTMARRVMRPHPDHRTILQTGPGPRRFLDATNPADVPIIGALPGGSGGFPFDLDAVANGGDGDGRMEMGALSWRSGFTTIDYEYDRDNDGDGTREGILLDLDFPVQENGAGVQFVPLFSFTVYDLDALINLNVHGNLFGDVDPTAARYGGPDPLDPVNKTLPISASNEGLSPSEVNALWALDTPPGIVPAAQFDQHRYFFRPTAPPGWQPNDRTELANMEWWRLNMGHVELASGGPPPVQVTPVELTPGRYGELQRLFDATTVTMNPSDFPMPGVAAIPSTGNPADDDNDQNDGERVAGRRPFVHPHDYRGIGRIWPVGSPKSAQLTPVAGAASPVQALQYADYSTQGTVLWAFGPDGAPGQVGVDDDGDTITDFFPDGFPDLDEVFTPATDDFTYMSSYATDSLINHPLEIMVEPEHARRPWDEIFGPEGAPFLHMSNGDISNSKEPPDTRLAKLAFVNFATDPTVNPLAKDIRPRFTTLSFDRKQFGIPRFPSAGLRGWEWNADSDQDGNAEFPPQFADGSVTVPPFAEDFNGNNVLDPGEDVNGNGQLDKRLDPFRPQLRRLLQTEIGNFDDLTHQFPLSINHVLDVERVPGALANERTGPLQFRSLTPHPVNLANTPVPAAVPLPPFPPTTGAEQEFWARRDRQMLARDIYVLLYTLCGGNDGLDYTTDNSAEQLHSHGSADPSQDRCRQMARFAANLVDAMDRDNVVTAFEYDKNLGNGWNLDDNPYDDEGGDRELVYGVEAQQLAISEALVIKAKVVVDAMAMPTNHDATQHDDVKDRYFTYIELRNTGPIAVNFNNEAWQIRVNPVDNSQAAAGLERWLTLRSGAGNVSAGSLYTIGSAGDAENINTVTANPESLFRVDENFVAAPPAMPIPIIAPRGGFLNLDLVAPTAAGSFRITESDGTTDVTATLGALLQEQTMPNDGMMMPSSFDVPPPRVTFGLYRRAHPERQPPSFGLPTSAAEEADNPWIKVDELIFRRNGAGVEVFELKHDSTINTPVPAMMGTDYRIPAQLGELRSRERPEALDATGEEPHGTTVGAADVNKRNSLSITNENSPAAFTLWQPHFDRDFASVVDLLSIPLYGPDEVTIKFANSRHAPTHTSQQTDPKVAGALFLNPSGDPIDGNDDNRWHRLLAFVQVPTRTHPELGNPLETTRVPGRINPNMLRHPEVLAALLDDREIIDRDYANAGVYLPDQSGSGPNRDWYAEFILARDGIGLTGLPDPVSGLYLPGVAGSKPFRSFGFSPQGNNSFEHTLLRSLPSDGASPNPRQLFELGTSAEHNAPASDPNHYMRHRMLSKIANNVTTRSNTFVVFISVDFFEAWTDPGPGPSTGAVRIGGQFDVNGDADLNNDGYRGVFILDRSDVEAAFDKNTGTFDWRALVKHRLRIQ